MRINQYISSASELSRRAADKAIQASRVKVNGQPAQIGYEVRSKDVVTLDNKELNPFEKQVTIMLHKPIGYVVSRQGQGSKTIYELLPESFKNLNPVGRLDKQSSGLLLLTNNGSLANELTHPRYQKAKVYEARLDKPLSPEDQTKVRNGILLSDGLSKLEIDPIDNNKKSWRITMNEGRNRQIRRTFEALGYHVVKLHRTHFGKYSLGKLETGAWVKDDSN